MSKSILVIGDSMSLAHATRAMVLARRLANEGAKVSYATGPAHQALARQEGFEPLEVYCVPPERAHAAIRRGSHIFDRPTLRRYVESDLALLRRERPDLVIGDMRLSLNISAELANVEHWSIVSGYLTRYYAAPQSPPRTFPAVRLLGDRISRAIFPALKALTLRYYAASFRRYRKELGLTPVADIFDVIASPHRNLIADLPGFIPCTRLPPHFAYVGPLVWEPDVPDPEWLGRLRADLPTAYVTMGSTGDPKDLSRILAALRDAGWQVMATIGQHDKAPDGVHAVGLARGSSLLRRSQVAVCHGGSGTIYQAIGAGVPIVGVATFHDQEINLERVEAMRWGVALDPVGWRESDLLVAMERVTTTEYLAAVAAGQEEIQAFVREAGQRPLLSIASGAS
jgi:UDP:flavonoid glycosyltransferase YjiC (YdhE family)